MAEGKYNVAFDKDGESVRYGIEGGQESGHKDTPERGVDEKEDGQDRTQDGFQSSPIKPAPRPMTNFPKR